MSDLIQYSSKIWKTPVIAVSIVEYCCVLEYYSGNWYSTGKYFIWHNLVHISHQMCPSC